MQVNIKQVEVITLIGKAYSNHWVTVDGPETFFGSEVSFRPMELLSLFRLDYMATDLALG
jgi:uncharacterized OsmC-like protein